MLPARSALTPGPNQGGCLLFQKAKLIQLEMILFLSGLKSILPKYQK